MKSPEERARDLRRAMCTHNGSTYATECFICIRDSIRAAVLEALDEVARHQREHAPPSAAHARCIDAVRREVSGA